MIDRRELLEKARERNLNLAMIEKDYVLGWVLFGFSSIPNLIFKGGTALSKIYFPKMWRLSEDLDFTLIKGSFDEVLGNLGEIFKLIERESGIKLSLKSQHSNPEYLQLRVQYTALLGKNLVKIDITKERMLDKITEKGLARTYSDYPKFKIKAQTIEEILAEKLRAIVQRKKSRDYYDVWQLLKLRVDMKIVKRIFVKKCELMAEFRDKNLILPNNLIEILEPYWRRELSRLVYPVPELEGVLSDLKKKLSDEHDMP